MEKLSPNDIWIALLAIAGAIVTIGKAVDVIKGWRKPQSDLRSELDACRMDLKKEKTRGDQHEEELATLNAGLIVTCKGVKALLEHELHNGNTTEMFNASKAIDDWLFEK